MTWGASGSRRYAWGVFALLFALMVVDHVDRQIVVSLLPRLKGEWNLSDTQLGGLVSIVSIAVALGVVPLSIVADRWGHVKSIFVMALVWSLATIACAFAGSYAQLLFARSVVGFSEAAYGTAGAALVAGLFSPRVRSTMLGAFLAAAVVGAVAGVMLGGVIVERWGWQAAFGVAGIPGVVLAVLFRLHARSAETNLDIRETGGTSGVATVMSRLLRTRTVVAACIGGGMQLLVVSATYAWLPTYLNRYFGLAPGEAGVKSGLIVLLGGVGAILWSVVADRLSGRMARARLYVPAATAVMTGVLMYATFTWIPPGAFQFWMIAACGLVMTGSVGPVAAVIIDVSDPGRRATATSILTLTQNLLGLAAGPLVAGVLADQYGLQFALAVLSVFALLAAVMFVIAAGSYLVDRSSFEGMHNRNAYEPQAP